MNYNTILDNQSRALAKIQQKREQKKKIKIAFFVVLSSTFASEPLYKLMLEDDSFDPMIVIIPDITRGEENMFKNLNDSFITLSAKYKKVLNSYSPSQKDFVDVASKFDMVCTANPYDALTHPYYRIANLAKLPLLSFYIPYGPYVSNMYKHTLKGLEMLCLWRIFFEQKHTVEDYREVSAIQGNNAVLCGSLKLDGLADVPVVERKRKKIILAPHHTVQKFEEFPLSISTFLDYYNFFLELPKIFEEIDFILRPHPLLFVTLVNKNIWTKEEVDNYIKTAESMENMSYQDGGDYFDTFINSDALIHDCGSFIIEYMFTNHPPCYIMNGEYTRKSLNRFSQKCLDNHYQAHNKEEIIDFIKNVVVEGNDPMQARRELLFIKELKYFYPHTAQKVLDYIKSEVFIKEV